jgi:hypothetical protein
VRGSSSSSVKCTRRRSSSVRRDQSPCTAGESRDVTHAHSHSLVFVNCSGGVGRTGVFVALSIVLERMQYEGVVDLLQTVRMLRTQRPNMVHTEVCASLTAHLLFVFIPTSAFRSNMNSATVRRSSTWALLTTTPLDLSLTCADL